MTLIGWCAATLHHAHPAVALAFLRLFCFAWFAA